MAEHLPECGRGWRGGKCCGSDGSEFGGACMNCPQMQDCICDRLRACEERVRAEQPDYKWDQEEVDDLRAQGYVRGLDDAKAAIEPIELWRYCDDHDCRMVSAATAAIDALKGASE